MTQRYDLRTRAAWFRLAALAEAVSWVGLLAGMYFKYLGTPRTEVGVQVFGMVHGLVFLAVLGLGVLVGVRARWKPLTWLAGAVAGVIPFASVPFLIWLDRRGLVDAHPRAAAARTA